ncbi:acetate non-utilizing protein 9 [Serendipita sp. 407]|nr:acetate non-utilizing protein 9 [Serendipita sp. 407]
MRCSLLRLAQPVLIDIASVDSSVRAARATLLPPLPLYRHLLRVHRRLPLEMRSLGDDYMKSEFRRHKDTSNKVHVMGFLLEWNKYLDQLEAQLTPDSKHSFRGVKMDDTMFEKMSDEQLGQLYELMHISKDVWKPVKGDNGGDTSRKDGE